MDAFATKARLRALLLTGLPLALAGCSGIDLGDNPSRDVSKQVGPLTALPAHLREGSVP